MGETTGRRRYFTPEFQQEAVRRMGERRAQRGPLTQIGRELDVRPDMLRAWKRQLDARGGATAPPSARPVPGATEAEEVRRLTRELARAQQEIAFLKSAAAYFARESR